MPLYDLSALDGHVPAHLDTFEASNLDEAIALALLRQERRKSELSCCEVPLAQISRDGHVHRVAEAQAG